MAQSISDFYQVSVLVQPTDADRPVTGTLRTSSIEQALASLSFMLGGSWRRLDGTNGDVYFIGGKAISTINVYPSYGLDPAQLGLALRQGVSVLGDKVVTETDEGRVQQIGDVLNQFKRRPALTLELWEISVSDTGNTYVNAWLQNFQLGANLRTPEAALQASNSFLGSVSASAPLKEFYLSSDMSALLQLLQDTGGVHEDTHMRIQCISGQQAMFQSGQVLQDVTYATVPNTTQQLQSSISFRTVGLQLTVTAYNADLTNWFLNFNFQDSSLNGATETTTSYSGERQITTSDGWFLVGSFLRRGTSSTASSVPILGKLPVAGRLFHTSNSARTLDNVVILARPVPEGFNALQATQTATNHDYTRN